MARACAHFSFFSPLALAFTQFLVRSSALTFNSAYDLGYQFQLLEFYSEINYLRYLDFLELVAQIRIGPHSIIYPSVPNAGK
jgi:hypothetical protein